MHPIPNVLFVGPSRFNAKNPLDQLVRPSLRILPAVSSLTSKQLFKHFKKDAPLNVDVVLIQLPLSQKTESGMKKDLDSVRRFLKQIRKAHSMACVILLAPPTTTRNVSELLRNGVYDYLTPPVSQTALLATIQRGLKNKEETQALMSSLQRANQDLLAEKDYFQRWSENLSRIYKINQSLVGYLNVDDLLCSFGASMKGLLPYETLSIFLRGYEEPDRAWIWAQGVSVSKQKKKAVLQALHEEVLQLGNRFLTSAAALPKTLIENKGAQMIVPLLVSGEKVGLLRITRNLGKTKLVPFDDYQSRLISMVTTPLCLTLHNARMYQRINALASTDELTYVLNRRAFLQIFEREFKRSVRLQSPLSLLLIDLDRFKEVNDHFGHLVGDQVLKETAALLKQAIREIDVLARYGGEEFVILLMGGQQSDAMTVAQRIRRLVEMHRFKHAGDLIQITVSMGVASLASSTAKNAEELFHLADLALYSAKENGRNCIECAPYEIPKS